MENVDEADRKQMGSFLAYLCSLLYGHKLDDRMRRVPAIPPPTLHGMLGDVTDLLLVHAEGAGTMAACPTARERSMRPRWAAR